MKRITATFMIVASTMFFCSAQADGNIPEATQIDMAIEANGPIMSFVEETIDYGTIEQNADGKREFIMTNIGSEPLLIDKCQGTCGCTVPQCPLEMVAPGETTTIQVKYATNRLGRFNKGVKVYSNASSDGQPKMLYIKGNVLTPEEFANQQEDTPASE